MNGIIKNLSKVMYLAFVVAMLFASCKQSSEAKKNDAKEEFEVSFATEGGGTLDVKIKGEKESLKSSAKVEKGKTIVFTAKPEGDKKVKEWKGITPAPTPKDKQEVEVVVNAKLNVKVIFENRGNNLPSLCEMEITAFDIGGISQNPNNLKDGNKTIKVDMATPVLNITFKEKYEELKGEVKVKNVKQNDIAFTTANAKYTFVALTKDEETDVEVSFSANDKLPMTLKFKLLYKPLDPLSLTKITVAGQDFAPPFETTLNGQTIEVKKASTLILVEAPEETEELSGSANDTPLIKHAVLQNKGEISIKNLQEGANPITLKVKAKEKAEVQYTFIVNYTKIPPVGIEKIIIDDKEFAKGDALDGLNNSEIEIAKPGDIDIKVELEEDFAGKKVYLKSGLDGVVTKDSDWVGKVATLKCKEDWKQINIIVKATDREDVQYTVSIERVKNTIDVARISLADENYGLAGKDLSLLLDTAQETEKVNVKKSTVNVKLTLEGVQTVDIAKLNMQPSTEINLNFTGNIAEEELTLAEGENACTLHLEKTTKKGTKIEANYKFIFVYTKSKLAFNYIKLRMDVDDKGEVDSDLPNIKASFVEESDVYTYKKENYSTWNQEATIISFTNDALAKMKYAVSDSKNLPTDNWQAYTKTFKVPLKSTPVYAYFKIEKESENRTYLIELTPSTTEKGIVESKTLLEYFDKDGEQLYAESSFTKKVKMIVKPQNPNAKGIVLKGSPDISFTKFDTGKRKNWYFIEISITDATTFNASCEVIEHNDAKTSFTQEIKFVPAVHEFAIGYAEDMNEKVDAHFENGKYTFSIDSNKVQSTTIYLRLKLHEYCVVSCSDSAIVFDGTESETVNDNTYIVKKATISNFASPKNFTLTIKQSDGLGASEFPVEITAN